MSDEALAPAKQAQEPAWQDRSTFVAFVSDAKSEMVIREALADTLPEGLDVRRGDLRTTIAALRKMSTPNLLLVDVSGEEHPLAALQDLSEVVEPNVRVLVIGDRQDVNFYRQLTQGLGVIEYLYKPLTRDMVARHFGIHTGLEAPRSDITQGGRVVSITGVAGGVGATTIAVGLAWHCATDLHRHTILVDPDLHTGTAALMLHAKTGPGLRTALETPQRLDELFIDRAAQPVTERLAVLAGEEPLADQPVFHEGAAQKLVATLRRRYNFIVVDLPFANQSVNRDLLQLTHQRVLVMEPSLSSVRDTLRLLALPQGPAQARRAIVVLNRAGQPGMLNRAQVEDALKLKVEIVIPYLPKQLNNAAIMGQPVSAMKGSFRNGILELAREAASVRNDSSGVAKPLLSRFKKWIA